MCRGGGEIFTRKKNINCNAIAETFEYGASLEGFGNTIGRERQVCYRAQPLPGGIISSVWCVVVRHLRRRQQQEDVWCVVPERRQQLEQPAAFSLGRFFWDGGWGLLTGVF